MKKLLIVESPAKIKTISKFLGPDFKIMSTVGHIKDLPERELGVTIDDGITIDYVVLEGKQKVINDIVKQARTCQEVFLAPDPDREGEIIAWHIGQEIERVFKNKDAIHRITFNEITKPAITQAIEQPTHIDMQKVAAQQARRVLDRWVGYEVSPVLWRKMRKGLSAGRVQSVALKFIVDREEEIKAFKPKEYWTVDCAFANKENKLTAALTHVNDEKIELGNQAQTEKIVKELDKQKWLIASIQDKQRKKNPAPPFMTSTLQQAAYNRLGFSVKKTMQVAQSLYEGVTIGDSTVALITYMRTDSLRISDTALKAARGYIKDAYGNDYVPEKPFTYVKGKKAQDAHEAIRPIDIYRTPADVHKFVEPDQAKLYTLIWQRFVASQMTPAVYAQRQVTIKGGVYTCSVTGSTVTFDGFLKLYQLDEDEEEKKLALPAGIKEDMLLDLTAIDPKQHFTQAPPRYTEASLVKSLEKEGIGRPSTYAAILNTIRKREYTHLDDKKRFVPTVLGVQVTHLLEQNMAQIMNLKFTAHMEEDLDRVAQGEITRDTVLREFYEGFSQALQKFAGAEIKKKIVPTDIDCPTCKKHKLVIRYGKSGEFLGCAGYPECKFTANFVRGADGSITMTKREEPVVLDQKCPKCGKPLQERSGRFGRFIACTGYPECKYTQPMPAPIVCPLCAAPVVQKRWKGGSFWGCSNYPKCTFAAFGMIDTSQSCPKCKAPFMVKKKTRDGHETVACWNKACAE